MTDPKTFTPPPPQEGDYASGWWGEEEAKKGQPVPGPYGRPSETRPDAPDLQPPPGGKRRDPRK